ncbi:MAG: hypothetical protein EBX90_14370, partial [Betaproteobacteria bacterium]|nr:hypothetical protein [Betaproteobacteria bacterium]
MLRHHGEFLYCHSNGTNDAICVRRAPSLAELAGRESVEVWRGPEGGKFSRELWAPELHATEDGWVIYVAADDGKNPHHRMVALVRKDPNPVGPYEFYGPLALEPDRWAIDGSLWHHPERGWFFVWSGWEGQENTAQHLYLCPMADPLTPSGPRVLISSPLHAWEKLGSGGPDGLPTINEGPQVLIKGGWIHVIYSAAGSWSDHYCLGRLSLPPGADPLRGSIPAKGSATRPIFKQSPTVVPRAATIAAGKKPVEVGKIVEPAGVSDFRNPPLVFDEPTGDPAQPNLHHIILERGAHLPSKKPAEGPRMHLHPAGGLLEAERFRPVIFDVMQHLIHFFSGPFANGFRPVSLAGEGPSLARLRQPVEQFQQQPDPENSGTNRVDFGHQGLRLLGRLSMKREAAPGFVHQAANSETFRRGPE